MIGFPSNAMWYSDIHRHHHVRLTVRTGTGAAVGIVSELVNVDSSFGRRIITGDIIGDGGRRGFGSLLKIDGAADLGVTTENCDCKRKNQSVSEKGLIKRPIRQK